MTRALTFDGELGPLRFVLLRTALLSAGDGKGERTTAIIRREARLLDALDTISDPTGSTNAQDPDRMLKPPSANGQGPLQVVVSQEDFELLQGYAEKTPWAPRAARQAVDLWDWLSSAERRDK